MLSHYLNTAVRHFRQHKLTTGINVACLALGLMCFMIAWGTVTYFEQRDRYHTHADRTYFMSWTEGAGADAHPGVTGAHALGPQLANDFPQLERVARMVWPSDMTISQADRHHYGAVAFVDPELFDIFDLPVIGAQRRDALRQPRSALVSSALAMRMFGTEDVVGRVLRLGGREDVTIAGLIGDIPQPSSFSTERLPATLSFEALVSMDVRVALLASRPTGQARGQWFPDGTITFLVLPADRSLTLDQLNSQLDAFAARHIPRGAAGYTEGFPELGARPLREATRIETSRMVGRLSGTTVLQLLGVSILLVAAINYANLATAVAGQRMRDVALRKIVGASQRAVMGQYLFEAFLSTSAALVIAFAAAAAIVVARDVTTLGGLASFFAQTPEFWWVIATVIVVVTLASGAYPALVLTRIRPIRVLRGSSDRSSRSWLATGLLGLQFAFASLMIIAVLVMVRQDQVLRRAIAKPGSDPVVMILRSGTHAAIDNALLRSELLQIPGVLSVSTTSQPPWDQNEFPMSLTRSLETSAGRIVTAMNAVGYDFFETLEISVIAGRDFDPGRGNDTDLRPGAAASNDRNVIIDEKLAQRFGFANPREAIGQVVYRTAQQVMASASRASPSRYRVIGVVEDTSLNPMPEANEGNLFVLDPNTARLPLIRISKDRVQETLAGIDALWKRLVPGELIGRPFADEFFEFSFYQVRQVERTLLALAGFALLICTMGLVGMAFHVIRRRTHEIGVRKTLGASVQQILVLLLRSFAKPVLIANLAIWPFAFLGAREYMSRFSQSDGIPFVPFLASLAITLAVAWLAVSIQATRAARVKPAEVLRYE